MPEDSERDETPAELEQRLTALAERTRAPDWLCEAVRKIAAQSPGIPPIEDNRASLPEFIYRH